MGIRGVPRILNGGLAGIVGVTCVFPIDLAKTRLQNQRIGPDGKLQYDGIVDCARKTWNSGGRSVFSKVRAIYSGSAVNILLITPEKAIKLCANDFFRYHLAVPGQKQLSVFRGMIAGGLTAVFQMTITTPMELLKIQLQDQGRTAAKGDKKLTAFTLARNLVRQHGFAGLYKGLNSTLARDVTFSAIYFPLFAYLDSLILIGSPLRKLNFALVVKTRIQTIRKGANDMVYKGVPDAFCSILRTEGPKALFKGAGCRVLVIAPLFGIAQTVYYIGVAEWILGMPKAHHV
ncbi:unnamed protein product [Haemonchus placei]|uniref:Mitochondrial glutamate carrier 1 n=1 Tax=Haemonchus placei TaxID=6290 RepID=A0A158QPW6_HAEPC|nr:unnamed protein product [Haemonchus placei]